MACKQLQGTLHGTVCKWGSSAAIQQSAACDSAVLRCNRVYK